MVTKFTIGDSKGLFYSIGLLLYRKNICRAILHIINNENELNFKDSDYRVSVKKNNKNQIGITVSGTTVNKVLNGSIALSSSLKGKYRNYVLLNPRLNNNNTMVLLDIEDTSKNYRINYTDYQSMSSIKGKLRLDFHNNNIWNYTTGQPHLILSGSTGSGKSQALKSYVNALATQNAKFKFIDPKFAELTDLGKKLHVQVSHSWSDSFTIMEFVIKLLKQRQRHKKTYKPFFLVIEEAASLITLAPTSKDKQAYLAMLKQILVTGRSANIHVISVMQAATAENVGGIELRGQYGVKILLGSPQQEEMQFLMPAGVSSAAFGKFAGLIYIEGQGVSHIQTPSKWTDKSN